ncbi:MAG: hypothetical protein ACLTR6_10650 [Clostridium fessum]
MQKLIGQFIITGIFAYYLMNSGEVGTDMLIPFTGGFEHGYLSGSGMAVCAGPVLYRASERTTA